MSTGSNLPEVVTIRLRRDTSANWGQKNPVLKLGEPGLETDTRKLKFGNGTTNWNNLQYVVGTDIDSSIFLENIDDRVAQLIKAGTNIEISYNDTSNELTISSISQTKSSLGLGDVDNTSDANKSISTAQQTALNNKANQTDIYNAAVQWTGNHTLADGTRYLANDIVYDGGKIYKAKFDNESLPTSNATYWQDIGGGYRLNIDGRDIPNIPYSVTSVITNLGNVSGSTPINYDVDRSIQTLTLDGTATTFTKGTGWPTSSNISVDTILRITVTSATSITWSVVNDWFNQPSPGSLTIGTHLFLIRAIGSSIIEGHYIGNKTN